MTQNFIVLALARTIAAQDAGWKAKLVVIAPFRHRVEFWHPSTGQRISGERCGPKHEAYLSALNAIAPFLQEEAACS